MVEETIKKRIWKQKNYILEFDLLMKIKTSFTSGEIFSPKTKYTYPICGKKDWLNVVETSKNVIVMDKKITS